MTGVSIEVPIDQLFADIDRWGFGYLATVTDDGRAHLLALRPGVVAGHDGVRRLRFDAGGRSACRNAAARSTVSVVFPPGPSTGAPDGMSLVVDGTATVDGDFVDIEPTWAVLHRKAPPAP